MYLIFGACCKKKMYAKVFTGFKMRHISELEKKNRAWAHALFVLRNNVNLPWPV